MVQISEKQFFANYVDNTTHLELYNDNTANIFLNIIPQQIILFDWGMIPCLKKNWIHILSRYFTRSPILKT
jgi:hypothetical protein